MSSNDGCGGVSGSDGTDALRRQLVAESWSAIEAEMESCDATTRESLENLRDQVTECLLSSRLLGAERLTAIAYGMLARE